MSSDNQLLQEGRYRINQQFPLNGQGLIYDAYDTVRHTNVLVKEIVLRMNKVTTPTQQEQLKIAFANQAKVLTEVKHDAVLHVHDFFSEVGRQYLVMESLEGDELSDLLAGSGEPVPVNRVLEWADQLLDGLHYLHTFNPPIVHKNIRPAHIKLTAEDRVKLLAFGLADGSDTRISANAGAGDEAEINYSPIEQIWDHLDPASQKVITNSFDTNSFDENSEASLHMPPDPRSDIYSLGATLYHLLTGRKPVDALERSIEMIDNNPDPLEPPASIVTTVPAEVSDAILRAMRVPRDKRFSSAAEMRRTFRDAYSSIKREAAATARHAPANNIPDDALVLKQRAAQDMSEQKEREPADEKQAMAQLLEQKLREAEELRIQAERRAAEAERLLRENEAAANALPTRPAAAPPAAHSSEVPEPVANVLDPVHESDPGDDFRSALYVEHDGADATEKYKLEHSQAPEPLNAPETAGSSESADHNEDYEFSLPQSRSSMPMAAVAGGGMLLAVIIAAVWFFAFSGPGEPAVQPQSVAVEQPAEQAPQPEQAAVPEASPEPESGVPEEGDKAVEAPPESNPVQRRTVAQADAPKKTAAATPAKPTVEKKKAVTVDDLISDH